MTTAPLIPMQYRGLWRRTVLADADRVDRTTRVLWLQSACGLFVDLRRPADRCADDRVSLGRQEACAGRLRVEGELLTWERWVDFQPPGEPDVARVTGEGDRLVEHGVHSDYYEEWERIAPDSRAALAFASQGEVDAAGRGCTRPGVLVVSGDRFAYAVGRTQPLPRGRPLDVMVAAAEGVPALTFALFDCVVAFGLRDEAGWRVTACTAPVWEGRDFRELAGGWRAGKPGWARQLQPDGVLRQWRVVATTPGLAPPPE